MTSNGIEDWMKRARKRLGRPLWRALPLIVLMAGLAATGGIWFVSGRVLTRQAMESTKADYDLTLTEEREQIEIVFDRLYDTCRVVASFPTMRDPQSEGLKSAAMGACQAIFDDLRLDVPVERMMVAFAPDAETDGWKSIAYFNEVDKAAAPKGDAIEAELQKHLAYFRQKYPNSSLLKSDPGGRGGSIPREWDVGRQKLVLALPAISSGAIKAGGEAGPAAQIFVYSVPFYDRTGRLSGLVSLAVPTRLLQVLADKPHEFLSHPDQSLFAGPLAGRDERSWQSWPYVRKELCNIEDASPWYLTQAVSPRDFCASEDFTVLTWNHWTVWPCGIVASLALSGMVWLLVTSRQRALALAESMTESLAAAKQTAEEASRAKSEFLARMSHEIRTPLNGVVGMVELLRDSGLGAQQHSYTQMAKMSAESLLNIVNDILDFSKIEAGKMELDEVDFELHGLVEEAMGLVAGKAASHRVELTSLVDMQVPTHVRGDAVRLRQILINLLSNAVKFTHDGAVSLIVALEKQRETKVLLRFAVNDTGIGIPRDRMNKLFRSFSQVDSSTTRQYGGTGLGLAISKQLAELMGGEMGVESEVGQGSTFWLVVPFSHVVSKEAEPASEVASAAGTRALVLSPHASQRLVLCEQFSTWDIRAEAAANDGEAIEKLTRAASCKNPFGLMLVDATLEQALQMPVIKAIRGDTRLCHMALVLLSPMGQQASPGKLHEAGFSMELVKPVRQSQLLTTIRELAARQRNRERCEIRASSRTVVPSHRKARVLVVEDNTVNQLVAMEFCKKVGHEFTLARHGAEAVEKVQSTEFDIVLMDCQMPVMDGFEATQKIRELEKAGKVRGGGAKGLWIVATTANAIKGDREKCLDSGMNEYLSKPLNFSELAETIDRLMEGTMMTEQPVMTRAQEIHPPADIETLMKNCGDDVAFLGELAETFRKQAESDLQAIERGAGIGDAETVRRSAHSLKGAASYLMALEVKELAERMEHQARTQMLGDIEAEVGEARREVGRCMAFIHQSLKAYEEAGAASKRL